MTNQHLLAEVSAKRGADAYKPGRLSASPKSTCLRKECFAEVPDTDAENHWIHCLNA